MEMFEDLAKYVQLAHQNEAKLLENLEFDPEYYEIMFVSFTSHVASIMVEHIDEDDCAKDHYIPIELFLELVGK